MSTPYARMSGPLGGGHPALLDRRVRELLIVGATGLIVLAVALGIALEVPNPRPAAVAGITLGGLGVLALAISTRYEVTLTLLVLYLGLLDGPVKLESASQAASAVRDILILAIGLGMVVRLVVKRERVRLPPLSAWVLAFVAVVLIEAFNPATGGILKVIGGYRQELEWVPLFFFGYLIMRSKERFRKFFLVLGVIAVANGAVGAYQARLTPGQLASWGPGYNVLLSAKNGKAVVSGRTYSVEGVARPRPPALGSDSGFGGGVGVLALPGLLALLATGSVRRRWILVLCCAGAVLGIATSASRSAIIVAVIALLAYALLSFVAGIRVGRLIAVLLTTVALTVAVGAALVAANGKGIFARQETLTSVSTAETSGGSAKVEHLTRIPADIAAAPFGAGLATGGSAGGFGGKQKLELEGQGASTESAYNLVVVELGLPGLLLWVGLSITVLLLAVRGLRHIRDIELRTYLVAVFAAFVAFTAEGFAGPTLAVSPSGAFLWFAAGIASYWFGSRRLSPHAALPAPDLPATYPTTGAGRG